MDELFVGESAGPLPAAAPLRKKFATPPVKSACLACRAARTRCNGGTPCASCQSRGRECEYRPSRRGYGRLRKKQMREDATHPVHILPEELVIEVPAWEPISLDKYIDPGAGLQQLPDIFPDSDFIFDSLFPEELDSGSLSGDASLSQSPVSQPSQPSRPTQPVPTVRTYATDQGILDAYYVFIHSHFPILPPPERVAVDQPVPHRQTQLNDLGGRFAPSTPITLAISAILALIPYPEDAHHLKEESVVFRRQYAQFLAQSAIESIEMENELPESSVEPPKALEGSPDWSGRVQFHPKVPLELETIIALNILSIYEYAQRGNLKKMQIRVGQALTAAMTLSLHASPDMDEFAEARRRTWWMTYTNVCQASIVGLVPVPFAAFSPFTTPYPLVADDPESFSSFIEAQQGILTATDFVADLNKAMETNGDMAPIFDRMRQLETLFEALIARSDKWILPSSTTSPVDGGEAVVGRALRAMARIKLNSARIKVHRYSAFYDQPIFTSKHCDLKAKDSGASPVQEPRLWPACCGGPTPPRQGSEALSPHSDEGVGMSSGSSRAPSVASPGHSHAGSPFSSHQSAKICLKSALTIAQNFEDLPYPNPTGLVSIVPGGPTYLSPTSMIVSPKTMPTFACCAIQCAYSLLNVQRKTKETYPGSGPEHFLASNLLRHLHTGLNSIYTTLENYAMSFEALRGMKEQIKHAMEQQGVI